MLLYSVHYTLHYGAVIMLCLVCTLTATFADVSVFAFFGDGAVPFVAEVLPYERALRNMMIAMVNVLTMIAMVNVLPIT